MTHHGSLRPIYFMLLVSLLLAACGPPDPGPLVPGEPVWQSGERSIYQVTNREEQQIGESLFEIVRVPSGRGEREDAAWTIVREVNDIEVTERASVQVQASGYLPLFSRMTRTARGPSARGSQIVEAEYGRGEVNIALTNRQGSTIYERATPPSDVRDARTLLPIVRTLPLNQGYATAINSFLPITGDTTRYVIWVVKSEEVTVPAGTYETWQLNLQAGTTTSRVWIDKEPPNPLIRWFDGGSGAVFELLEFDTGGR